MTGHSGTVGELGVNAIYRPTHELILKAGPRLSFVDSRNFQTYFGVTPAEAGASAFTEFTPKRGFKSEGLDVSARYPFNKNLAAETGAGWDRLVGDAARSPITQARSKNQFTLKLGLIRKFQIDF